jgi:hypothetical protein
MIVLLAQGRCSAHVVIPPGTNVSGESEKFRPAIWFQFAGLEGLKHRGQLKLW